MSEIVKLLGLAWERCAGDVFAVIRMWIGSMVGFAAWFVFFVYNFGYYSQFITQPIISGVTTNSDVLLISGVFGIINAFAFLTFIAIVVCLFEYALSFTIVCYYYDNCSWVVPNAIRDTAKSVSKWYWDLVHKNNMLSKESSKKSRESLMEEIAKIKKPDEL